MDENKEPIVEETEESKKRKAQYEIRHQLIEKIKRVSNEIADILEKEGLDLQVTHSIAIVPLRKGQ